MSIFTNQAMVRKIEIDMLEDDTQNTDSANCPKITNAVCEALFAITKQTSALAVAASISTAKQVISLEDDTVIAEFASLWQHSSDQGNQSLEHLMNVVEIPAFIRKEHLPLQKEDFKHVSEMRYEFIMALHLLFDRVLKLNLPSQSLSCLYHVSKLSMIVLSQHMEENDWTDSNVLGVSTAFLSVLLKYFDCKSIGEFLSGDLDKRRRLQGSVFAFLMKTWKPNLTKDCWKSHPTISAAFVWCLVHLEFPKLSEFLDIVLPPSLLFVDDYSMESKLQGILCLRHIIKNVTNEELRWYGRSDVVFEALKHQLYHPEVELVHESYPAILEILKVVERKQNMSAPMERHDDVFGIIVHGITHENKIVLRRARTMTLAAIVTEMGIQIVKHLQKLIPIIEEYLEIADGPDELARLNVLQTLESLIMVAWPRIPHHSNRLAQILVKLMVDISIEPGCTPSAVVEVVLHKACRCLELLLAADSKSMSALLTSLSEVSLPSTCNSLVKNVLNTIK